MFFERKNAEISEPSETYYIYRISGIGKSYVGMSKDPLQRFEQHLTGQGSQLLLHDIVSLGLSSFSFEILAEMKTDDKEMVEQSEDYYITKFNCLQPLGYNLRMNRTLVANGMTNSESFEISAKFVHGSGNNKFFCVGEYSRSRDYQTLLNLPRTDSIVSKKKYKFKYFQIKIETERQFQIGQTYELNLKLYENELIII
jgi:group I intron endonuclease